MNKLKLASGVILLFLVGALAGSLGTIIYFKQCINRFEAGGPKVPVRVRILLERFSDELDLTDTQRAELGEVVRETQEKIFALGRKVFPEIEEINEQGFAAIKEKLNTNQKKKLDVIYQKIKEFRPRFRKPPPFSPRMQERVITLMRDRLKLAPEQEAKVRALMDASEKEQEKIMEKHRGQDPPDSFSSRRERRENEKFFEKQLSTILTEKQIEEYRKIQKEERQPMREKDFDRRTHGF